MNKLNNIIKINVILFLLVAFSACNSAKSNNSTNNVPIPVKTQKVKSIASQRTERVPGNIQPALESQLESKISARILKFLAKEGDKVMLGQTLAELDDREIQAKLTQAIAAQKQAEQDLKRFSQLLPAGAVTKQEYETAETRFKIAEASVVEAKAMVAYSHITAPYDGIITKKLSQEGDLASPGKSLLWIEKQDLYRFETDIPETLASGISQGEKLSINISGLSEPVIGEVSEISPTTDPNSRTLHIKINLPNEKTFRSGQFGYVLIPLKEDNQIYIPTLAIIENGQLESVYVVQNNIAYLRLIRTGKRNGQLTEVLSGLSAEEEIVLEDLKNLTDSTPVEVK